MAGIDFGAAFNTFVGLQQRQAEETRQERNDAFELEAAKLKLQLLAQEDTRQERDLKLRETEGKQMTERFGLEQQRRQMENDILLQSKPFAMMQDRIQAAEALSVASQKERAFREAGQTKSADLMRDAINQADTLMRQQPQQGETGGTTPASQEGAPSGKGAGSEPPVVDPTQAGPSSPQAMVMDPPRQSEDFYKRVRESKSGDRFKSAEGTEFQVVDSPEQVQADQLQRQRWAQTFGKDVPYPNSASLVSKKDMEIEEGKFKAAARRGRMEEMRGQAEEELMTTIDQQNQINKTLKDAKSSSRIMATPEGVAIQGFSIDNLGRERAGLERLAEAGQLNRQVLEGYNNSFGAAFEKKLGEPAYPNGPPLIDMIERTGGNDFRIKFGADPKSSAVLNDVMRFSEAMEQNGLPPAVILRRSTPVELVKDLGNRMPQGSQMREQSDAEVAIRGRQRPKPLDFSKVDEVNGLLTKLTAEMGRSLFDLPPDQREAAKAEALNQLAGMQNNYFIGQGDYTGRKEAMEGLMEGPSKGMGGPVMGGVGSLLGVEQPSIKTPVPELRERLQQLQSILKPKAAPQQAPRAEAAPGATSAAGPAAIGIRGAATLMALGAAANVSAANKAFGSVTAKTKDKAPDAVKDVRAEYSQMTDKEKAQAQKTWQAKRKAWQGYGVKEATLRDMNEAVGLSRNDGF